MSAALVAAAITSLNADPWVPPISHWEIATTDGRWGAHGEIGATNEGDAYAFLRNVAETHRVELADDGRSVTVDFEYDEVPVRFWWLRPIVRWVVPERCATCPTKLGAPDVQFVRLVGPDGAVICVPCRDAMQLHWVAAVAGESVSGTRAVTALAALIHASQQRRSTAYGIALDVDRAQMLMSPETAAEMERLRGEVTRLSSLVACAPLRDMYASAERENTALKAERDRYRSAWLSARERAVAYGEGILRVVEDRETYEGWLKTAETRVAELEAEVATAAAPPHARLVDAEQVLRTARAEGSAT